MNLLKVASCILLLGSLAGATEIWHYVSGPMIDGGEDLSLKPPGLGDHFDITITFAQPVPFGTDCQSRDGYNWGCLNALDPQPTLFNLQPQITWTDGAISFNVGYIQDGAAYSEIQQYYGVPFVSLSGFNYNGTFSGNGTFAFTGPQDQDQVLVCKGTIALEECGNFGFPYYTSTSNGIGGSGWTITDTPEPATMALVGAAFLALAGIRRKRRAG